MGHYDEYYEDLSAERVKALQQNRSSCKHGRLHLTFYSLGGIPVSREPILECPECGETFPVDKDEFLNGRWVPEGKE